MFAEQRSRAPLCRNPPPWILALAPPRRTTIVGRLNSAEPSREPATIRRSAAGGLVVLIDWFCPEADR
jgi:hypothetical protein